MGSREASDHGENGARADGSTPGHREGAGGSQCGLGVSMPATRLLLQVCPWSSYLTGAWKPGTEHAVIR